MHLIKLVYRFLILGSSFLCLFPLALLAQADSTSHLQEVLEKYDGYIAHSLKETGTPGVAIAIVTGNDIVYLKGFGVRRVGQPEKIDTHTVFRIASLSKGFAAIVAGLLVQEGWLHWSDKVITHLPDFSMKDSTGTRALSIQDVLSHTCGLPRHTFDNLIEDNVPYQTILARLKEVPRICTVGACYSYQNVMYNLISEIVAAVTSQDYRHVIKARLFSPLGMHDASLSWREIVKSTNFASPHVRSRKKWRAVEIDSAYYAMPAAAGINASITDMAQWLRALLGARPEIVPPRVVEEVTLPLVKTPRERRRLNWNGNLRAAHYGMGWRVLDYAGTKMIFHSGSLRGFLAQIAVLPEHGLGIAILLNARESNALMPTFLDLYLRLRARDEIVEDGGMPANGSTHEEAAPPRRNQAGKKLPNG